MASSSWLSPSLPRAPAACRALGGCGGSPGLSGTGRERTRSPASLFIFAVRGSVLSARLGIPAPLAPPPCSCCRAVPLRWLREELSLVPSWGQALSGTGARLQRLTPRWRPVLAASPRPGWGTQRFGSCSGGPRSPARLPKPGDSGLWRCQPEQGSAGDSCSPGGRACSGCLPPFPGLPGAGGAPSFLIPGTGRGWNLCADGEGSWRTPAAPWKQKPCLHQTALGLLAPAAVAQRGPGSGRCPPQPAHSPAPASARRSSSCSSGFGNAGAAWKQKPRQSRGCLLAPSPLQPSG